MQEIVKERLPKFTVEEIKMVKGSIDYVGINQYTSYYMYDPHLPEPQKPTRYANDWNCGFACESPTPWMQDAKTMPNILLLLINSLVVSPQFCR